MQAQTGNKTKIKENEIDLSELWNAIFSGKLTVFVTCIAFSLLSIWYALSQPNIYKASILLTSADSQSANGNSLLSGQLGNLASFAGFNLPNGGNDKTMLALEILQSRAFIEHFIVKNQLFAPLLATKGWDSETEKLIYNIELYDVETNRWLNSDKKPSLWEAYTYFLENLNVIQNKSSGTITVEFSYYSPKHARSWLEMLIEELNELMREEDKKETLASIDFLSEKLNSTQLSSMKNVFYKLIEEQTKRLMLAEIKKEYSLKTIDPSQVPDTKDKPKRALIVILAAILGVICAVFIVLFRYYKAKAK